MISEFIKEDTRIPEDAAHMLAVGMVGTAQVSARYWLGSDRWIPQEEAEQLMARLAWRGISGWPLNG